MVNMNLDNRRKRARLQRIEPLEDDELSIENTASTGEAATTPATTAKEVVSDYPRIPTAFLCPLTLEIMFDPVMDGQGNTFERRAVLTWLKDKSISPISRKPLSDNMLIDNIALRDIIHNFMGGEWVERKTIEHSIPLKHDVAFSRHPSNDEAPGLSPFRQKIDNFLLSLVDVRDFAGLPLSLDQKGSVAFRYEDVVIVLDVPETTGIFYLYTRDLIHDADGPTKDRLLELNLLQSKYSCIPYSC